MNYKPYSHNSITIIDGQGKKITVEVKKEIAAEWNRFNWREDYQERKRRAPVKGKDADGNTLDFDPMGDSRECSREQLVSLGSEPRCDYEESLEDRVLNKVFTDNRMNILDSISPILSDETLQIINAEKEGISPREYQKRYGTPRTTYLDHREKTFHWLRYLIEAIEREKGYSSLARMRKKIEKRCPYLFSNYQGKSFLIE